MRSVSNSPFPAAFSGQHGKTPRRLTLFLTLLGVQGVAVMAGCLEGFEPYGGEDTITGTVGQSHNFDRTDPQDPDFRGWHGSLLISTNRVNRERPDYDHCLFSVQLHVNSRDHPDAYRRISTFADEEGRVNDMYIEFKGLTTFADEPNESMTLVELEEIRPPPAGEEWRQEFCDED